MGLGVLELGRRHTGKEATKHPATTGTYGWTLMLPSNTRALHTNTVSYLLLQRQPCFPL